MNNIEEQTPLVREALHLQEMESNPLGVKDIEMFEMFERENWPLEKRHAHIIKESKKSSHPS